MSEEAQPLVKDGSSLNRYGSTFSTGTGHDDSKIPSPRTPNNNSESNRGRGGRGARGRGTTPRNNNNGNNNGAAAVSSSASTTAYVQIDPSNRTVSGNLNNNNSVQKSCCRAGLEQLKFFRFEIIVILILILCIAVTFFSVYRHVHTDFNFHEECVRCFANAVSTFDAAFNQSSGHCIIVPGGHGSLTPEDRETIVISPGFCGAPECQSKALIGHVRVAPYWLVFLSSICAIVLSVLVNFTKDVVILPLKKACYKACDWPLPQPKNVISQLCDEEYQGDAALWHEWRHKLPKARASARAIRSFGVVDPFLYLLLLAVSFGHFIYVVIEVCTGTSYRDLARWEKYETAYGLILNSGTVEVWGIYYAQAFVGEFARILGDLVIFDPTGQDTEDLCALPLKYFAAKTAGVNGFTILHFAPPLLIPIFFTHVVPAACIFLPMALLLLLPYGVIGYIAKKKIQVGSWDDVACCGMPHAARMYILFFVTRVVSVFCVVCFVQTLTNYSIMFYSGDYSWTEVIVEEVSHRNTRCYLNAFLNKLQVYNVALAGFFLS